LSGYWPRFYIADKALGEAQVGSERINEVCQNIITYSTLSEFISFMITLLMTRKSQHAGLPWARRQFW